MKKAIHEQYGVHYFNSTQKDLYTPNNTQLYYFQAFIGPQDIEVSLGDCVYYFNDTLTEAFVKKGPCKINSKHLATVVRGYMHPNAACSLEGVTTLPYVNGCSTKQLFPPLRIGDPTLQYLKVPPHSSEQAHHIHSTYRVVLILSGEGKSVVGLDNHCESQDLKPGTVCIFEPMSPHHFETPGDEALIALPLHIFSSPGAIEKNHPMFNGTVNL